MKYRVFSILIAVVACLLMVNTSFADIVGNHGTVQSIPEPTTMLLIAAGGAALYATRRLTNKRKPDV